LLERLSIVARIQAHPAREELWPDLIRGLEGLPVEVSLHASDPPDPWAGYQRALESGLDDARDPTHVLVIQEDTLVCRNFLRTLLRIAAAKPNEPVCLFLSWLPGPIVKVARQARKNGERYVQVRPAKFCPVLAVLWPREAAVRFLAWTRSGVKLPGWPDRMRSDDAILAAWIKKEKEIVWVTMPSLVEHPDTTPSVKGRQNALWGKDRGRIAMEWIGPERDPLELDWS
jgi:hypothetical protein